MLMWTVWWSLWAISLFSLVVVPAFCDLRNFVRRRARDRFHARQAEADQRRYQGEEGPYR